MNRIAILRAEKNLSQRMVSVLTGIDQSNLSKMESGVREMPLEICEILATFYDTSMDYLVGLTDERNPYPRSENYKVKYPLD